MASLHWTMRLSSRIVMRLGPNVISTECPGCIFTSWTCTKVMSRMESGRTYASMLRPGVAEPHDTL